MFEWLKKIAGIRRDKWVRGVQPPRVPFAFPAGTKLRPLEDVVIGFPAAVFGEDKAIGSVVQCDSRAQFTVPPGSDMAYLKLKAGMVLSMTVSCELVVCADDDRQRRFELVIPARGK